MSLIIQAFTFAVQFGALCLVWRYTTEHNKRDFVFWVIGIMLAAQNSRFFGSVLITQMRYLFIPMMLCAIAFRWQMLRGNLGFVAKLYILLTLLIFVASAWSRYPKIFFEIKLILPIERIVVFLTRVNHIIFVVSFLCRRFKCKVVFLLICISEASPDQ